ncbi:HEAT repeat domain-containing protein [Amnibacterium sp. CER49]|uniref:HEAT repeat domain-containing protein n=1 Tax=Amnibacterium sp. CER49 TaxID=3039161 RepID=UPI00244879CF|nr:HEAT repeat domain-containing protein [Amnibacterium sp. CER49]MDH2444539.1 HEAT repeat domain-containing protein [Amnibacterium sp. CER49]
MNLEDLALRLRAADGSARMRAAMDAGSSPYPPAAELLVERCGIEPDFFVRDMLTWALTRLPADRTVPLLVEELSSPFPQARSQSLHTLSKIGDPRALPALTSALLHDEEDEVARAAWRAAVALTPMGERPALAAALATELGLRSRECWRTLSDSLVRLGESARDPLEHRAATGAFLVRVHSRATLLLLDGLAPSFPTAVEEAERLALEVAAPPRSTAD